MNKNAIKKVSRKIFQDRVGVSRPWCCCIFVNKFGQKRRSCCGTCNSALTQKERRLRRLSRSAGHVQSTECRNAEIFRLSCNPPRPTKKHLEFLPTSPPKAAGKNGIFHTLDQKSLFSRQFGTNFGIMISFVRWKKTQKSSLLPVVREIH